MQEILTRAGCFVAIIVLGYLLKKLKFFPDSAFTVLSKIVIRVTLPATIVTNFAGKEFDMSLLAVIALGLGFNLVYLTVMALLGKKQSREALAFDLVNTPSYNIGTFTLPFVQSFLGPMGVVTTSLFDTGNAFISLGGSYAIGSMVKSGAKFSFRRIGRALVRSMPFMTYIVMLVLALLHLKPPAAVMEFAGIIGSANAFLAMLMIGVGFHLELDKAHIGKIVKILSVRYGFAVLAALLCWFVLPFSLEIRQALVLLVFSPTASASPGWTAELDGDVGLASAIGSVSVVCSIVIILCLLPVIL